MEIFSSLYYIVYVLYNTPNLQHFTIIIAILKFVTNKFLVDLNHYLLMQLWQRRRTQN